jgi:predicted DsbA family dithiol-disulfide isomerase
MPCDECSRLSNQFTVALAAYKDAVGGMSGLHGFDLQFRAANERSEKARQRFETCRAALQEHERHHVDLAKQERA